MNPSAVVRWLVPRVVRNWLRRPSQSLARARDELDHLLGRDPLISPREGWSFRAHPAARRAFTIPRNDPRQREELDGFIAWCRPDMVLFDIGAHFGLFSLAALHYGGPTARAIAVEASSSAVRVLQVHARLNQVTDRLRVVHAAATAQPGWHVMLPVGVIADGYYIEPDAQHPASDLVRVPAVTVDGLVEEFGLAPTHLKVDVEGAEANVLRGARRALTGDQPPWVFLELHNDICRQGGREPGEALRQLTGAGYCIESPGGTPMSHEEATRPALIRLVARRPTVQFPAP
jgi:FkbM family methyltransferase